MFQPLERKKVYEEIASRIEELIDKGYLCAGDRLPTERRLSETFRVSRPSVRLALKTLERQGFVETRQGTGTFISCRTPGQIIQPLASLILAEKKYQIQILEMRRLIEPRIAFLAAERVTRDEMVDLERTLILQMEEVRLGDTGADLDKVFHYLIARAAKNRALLHLVDNATDMFSENRNRYLQVAERPQKSVRHHREILGAIAVGDRTVASDVMNEHLEDIHRTLFAEE